MRRLAREADALLARYSRIGDRLQRIAGIPDSLIEAIESSRLPKYDDRWWRTQIEEAPATESLDDITPPALDRLLQTVDRCWLEAEAAKPWRLGKEFLSSPLHLVSGTRIPDVSSPPAPQRFAQMLLVCQDHLDRRDDLDFFSASMFVAEVAVLGNSLDLLPALGDEAVRKFERLSVVENDIVSSSIYELLVGFACLRKGLDLTMLAEDRSHKTPDYRVHKLGPPAVIECKRRLGLTQFEIKEARQVETLYTAVRASLRHRGIHGAIEVCFRAPVDSVSQHDFEEAVLAVTAQGQDVPLTATSWGQIAFERLPYTGTLPVTRLYSPDYLKEVFGCDQLQDQWDGLLCEVEPPASVRVSGYRDPLCLKWRSESQDAILKKSRGITSLWTNAAKQIPAGEMGFIYIAYPEGARPALADARTRHIVESAAKLWHRWSIRIPVTVIGRLYPRPLGPGMPDLIESALPGAAEGNDFWLTKFPSRVFTTSSP